MAKTHPPSETLHRFVAGRLGERQNLKVAWHLAQCTACRKALAENPEGRDLLAQLFPVPTAPNLVDPSSYDTVISRTFSVLLSRESDLAQERLRAPQLFAELMRHPITRQKVLIGNLQRFRTWGLTEHLLARSADAWFESPARAEDLAELALVVADSLEESFYGPSLLHDLAARCWTHLANARRLGSNLIGAEEAFTRAAEEMAQGTSDPLERAHLLRMQASLRRDQRQFDEATRMLRRAVATYRRVGDSHLAGKALLKLSTIHLDLGEPDRAIEVLRDAMDLIVPEREPLLALGIRHNLIDALTEAERYMEARALLVKSRPLYRRHGRQPAMERRRLWVKAKIACGLGQYEQAEAGYLEVQRGFIELGLPYDTAVVSLELATVYAHQGRTADVKRLAQETLGVFRSLDIRREALAALIMFKEAAEAEQATVAFLRQLARQIRSAS